MAEDLLTLARAEREDSSFEVVQLSNVFEELVRELGPALEEKQIQLRANFGDTRVLARSADLQRVQTTFTVLENRTASEMVRQRTMLNNLATLASQRQ